MGFRLLPTILTTAGLENPIAFKGSPYDLKDVDAENLDFQ